MPYDPKPTIVGDGYIKMGIMGPPGCGKTWLASEANWCKRFSPSLILMHEGGLKGIELMENRPDNTVITGWDDLYDTFKTIRKHILANEFPYKSLIFDTYSELYKTTLKELALRRTKFGKDANKSLTYEQLEDLMWEKGETYSEYEYVGTNRRMQDIVVKMRDLPIHLFLTCHTKTLSSEKRDEKGNVTFTKEWEEIAVSQGSIEPVARLLDTVAYYEATEGVENGKQIVNRDFYTKPRKRFKWVKTRGVGENIGDLTNPTMLEIVNLMYGDKE